MRGLTVGFAGFELLSFDHGHQQTADTAGLQGTSWVKTPGGALLRLCHGKSEDDKHCKVSKCNCGKENS